MDGKEAPPPDSKAGVEAYSERVVAAVLGYAETASIVLGEALGWYAALADAGSSGLSADALAANSRTQERYAREWLEQQAAGGFLELVPGLPASGTLFFRLPDGAAEVLVQEGSLAALMPMVRMLRAGVAQLPRLLEVYRDGGGVPWSEVGADARESQAAGNRPWFEQKLAPALESVASLHQVLSRPRARIADVGAGCGWSSLALARAYPQAGVVGIDIDAPSIEQARKNARSLGLEDRVEFRLADAATPEVPGSYDAAFIFEALHDMPFPVQVLSAIRRMVKPDGAVVVMDEAVGDTFSPESDVLERLMYAYSLFICLPDSLSTSGSAGTGTLLRPPLLERYAAEAGYAGVERLPIEDFSVFRFYRLSLAPNAPAEPVVF